MKSLKKLWKFFSGKKRTIAVIYWGTVLPGLAVIYPDGIPGEVKHVAGITGLVLTYLGLGHALVKNVAKR